MNEKQTRALIEFLGAGVRVLSARIVLVMAMLLTFSLFCWALYLPGELRLAAATLFALLVFLPIIRLDHKQNQDRESVQGE